MESACCLGSLLSLEQHDSRHATELLASFCPVKSAHEAPEPHHFHLPFEPACFVHCRTELCFAPATLLEERGAFSRRELKRCITLFDCFAPRSVHDLHQPRAGKIYQPESE